jgi:hypothetical protein
MWVTIYLVKRLRSLWQSANSKEKKKADDSKHNQVRWCEQDVQHVIHGVTPLRPLADVLPFGGCHLTSRRCISSFETVNVLRAELSKRSASILR